MDSPYHLLEDHDSLRGLAHRTKSTSRGMPFGLLCCGFLGHTVDVPWCSLWLNLVRTALHQTAQRHCGFQPDFLIPQVVTTNSPTLGPGLGLQLATTLQLQFFPLLCRELKV